MVQYFNLAFTLGSLFLDWTLIAFKGYNPDTELIRMSYTVSMKYQLRCFKLVDFLLIHLNLMAILI